MDNIKSLFQIDPSVHFLNHGSFGACPKPVFETYQEWQRCIEHQPVEFLGRRAGEYMETARTELAQYLGALPDEVVYFPNPTTAMNMVARNLRLDDGDEILTTDHEYGAMDRTWSFTCGRLGAHYIHRQVTLPLGSREEFVEGFWEGVNPHTRVIFISHITSPTALLFPIEEILRRARQAGILTIVDGAHAPGQIPLDLHTLDADIYTGACHKWLCAPKGAAFLYARKEAQSWLDPLVVSWGYDSEKPGPSRFIDYHEWQGTRDLSAFLSVPAAIRFQREHHWDEIRRSCHDLAVETRTRINALTGCEAICPEDGFVQLFAARLPEGTDLDLLKQRLYDIYRIEVPLIFWNNQKFIRISVQGYNTPEDYDALLQALSAELTL